MIKQIKKLYYKKKLKAFSGGKYYIAIDFDGTLVKDRFPRIGMTKYKTVKKLTEYTNILRSLNIEPVIILWTRRTNEETKFSEFGKYSLGYLDQAKDWCERRLPASIRPKYYNENPERGHGSPKVFAQEYWDNRSRRIK